MPHILVIDDRPLDRIPFQDHLTGIGISITIAVAAHGKECLAEYRQRQPSLAIVAIKMADPDAMETIFNLRELEPELPILLTEDGVPIAVLDGSDSMPDDGNDHHLLQAVRKCLVQHEPGYCG